MTDKNYTSIKISSPDSLGIPQLHEKLNPLISQILSLYFHQNFPAMTNHTEHLDKAPPFLSALSHFATS